MFVHLCAQAQFSGQSRGGITFFFFFVYARVCVYVCVCVLKDFACVYKPYVSTQYLIVALCFIVYTALTSCVMIPFFDSVTVVKSS